MPKAALSLLPTILNSYYLDDRHEPTPSSALHFDIRFESHHTSIDTSRLIQLEQQVCASLSVQQFITPSQPSSLESRSLVEMSDDSPFRFLGLPHELRLDIYELIFADTTISTISHLLHGHYTSSSPKTFIDPSPEALRVSKQIRKEATPVLHKAIERLIIDHHACECYICPEPASTSLVLSRQHLLQNVKFVEIRYYGPGTILPLQNVHLPSLQRVAVHAKNLIDQCFGVALHQLEDTKTGLHDIRLLQEAKTDLILWARMGHGSNWQEFIDWLLGTDSTAQVLFKLDCLCNWGSGLYEFTPRQQYLLVSRINSPYQ